MKQGREAERSLMKREKSTGPRTDPCGTPRRTRKLCKRAYQKGKIDSNEQSKKEASRNEFVEKGGMPDRVKSFREVNSRENRPRARLGFVKSI